MLSPTPPINRPSLHPGAGYLIGPRVPHGLAAVVEGLTREVLRHRPEDIYVFAAHHFEKLLKLREQYHAEKYCNTREFDDDYGREFNLWPTKESGDTRVPQSSGWPLDKEVKVFERRGKVPTDMEESPEDVSTDMEKQKVPKQTSIKGSSGAKKVSRRSTKDATKIIPQMSALRSSGKTILTKDIKQELRKNKLNAGEKGKSSDSVEKGIRGERRSRTKISKTSKSAEEEIEHAAMMTAGRTSTRRPLKKVRRVETESETETEREIVAKDRLGNGYERMSVKGDSGSRSRRPEAAAWPSEHSSERKVSSRALSMDRIRAYVLRKFASTASLEVLRSPTYVEQVQEVIDRAAPIIKEKLEEIRKPRGKRSRSVDFAWNEESFRQCVAKDSRRSDDRDEEEKSKRKNGNDGLEQESNDARREDKSEDQSARLGEMAPSAGNEEKRPGRRGSGRRSRRRESGGHGDFGVVCGNRVDDDSELKSEQESGVGRDTLEARLTATQSILEGISMSASELNGARKVDPAGEERGEPTTSFEASDHMNVVSLPFVRPPSSKSCRNAAKSDSDSLTLPPISPEAPKSTKKKDELSLPILPAAPNGNHSKRSQEQDVSKDAEEASTMRDITSDMEDIAVLPEDEDGRTTAGGKQDLMNDHQDLISDVRAAIAAEDEEDKDAEEILWKDTSRELAGKRVSDTFLDRDLEEYEESKEPEEGKAEEVYKDSLNVTPEVVDVPPRPDSLELEEDGQEKLQGEDDVDNVVRNNTFDGLKDRLIEIQIAERNIEKALAGQQTAAYNDEATSEAGRSTSVEKIDETRKSNDEMEKVASDKSKLTSERGTPSEEEKSTGEKEEKEESANEEEEEGRSDNVERSTSERSIPSDERKSINEKEGKEESTIEAEEESNNAEGSTDERRLPGEEGKSTNGEEEKEESASETKEWSNNVERSPNEKEISGEERKSMNAEEEESTNEAEPSTMIANEELIEENGSKAQAGVSTLEAGMVPNGVEELMVKRHMKNLESTNTPYKIKNDQIVEVSVRGTDGKDDVMASNGKTVTANASSQTTGSGNTTIADEYSGGSFPADRNGVSKTKARKRRKANDVSATTPLSMKIPFSYVLSEGSPCEIPDSVTTVIIPDRPCPSPVIPEIEDHQLGSAYLPNEPITHDDIVEDVSSKDEDHAEYGMEAFGEYVRPEIDVDFVHGAKGAKPSHDIVIVHQDLDRIKEEGEEEEEDKKDDEREEKESHLEKDDEQAVETAVEQVEEIVKLEDIAEHEENETINEEIPSSRVPGSEALPKATESIDLTNAGRTDVTGESKNTLDNSSEENGSSHDIHTTTSSEAKESTVSNQSIESSSVGRPIVPELNLDSLQDNTVSSFKMTANGTATKESNGSPRESDATMSLVEPLTPDERLTMGNRPVLADRELETPVEELALNSPNLQLQSDVPEADQLYPAEHAEYELLEKDPLSSEAVLENEAKVEEEDVVGLEASSEDAACAELTSREKRESKELDSEEEIAKELIGLLDKEAQLHAEESGRGEKPENHEERAENNLNVEDETNRSLSDSAHSISIDEAKEEKGDTLSGRNMNDEDVSRTEAISELSDRIADSTQKDEAEGEVVANTETENSKLEDEEKEHVESSQVANLAEFKRDEFSVKDNATTNEETEKSEVEAEEKEHVESNQVTLLAESEREESSAKDEIITSEENEEPKEEIGEKKHIESSQGTPLTEFEQDESLTKDNAATNEEIEEPKEEVTEEKKHIETSQVAPLAEFERDELSEENGSHEMPDGKLTAEDDRDVIDVDFTGDQESPEDKRMDVESVLKSQSSESTNKEEFYEKREDNKHEELEDRRKSEENTMEAQEECQEEELSNEGKRERQESIAHEEENQEHTEVQEATISREGSLKKSTEEYEEAEHDKTAPTESITLDEFIADDQSAKDTANGEEKEIDDLSAKLESVHGPITSAISTQDYHDARYWTMGTKSSTAETVIAAFGSNTSADKKSESLDDTPRIVQDESITQEKDDFYSAVVKIQACIRGFLARHHLRKDLCADSVRNGAPLSQETAVINNKHLLLPEECLSLREARSGRHRLRREEALRKTTLSLENAFATSRLQHTGEFHDSVPLPLYDMTHSETDSNDSLDESLDKEEELTKTDTAKSSMCETTDDTCHNGKCQGEDSQKNNAFADHSHLPIMMHLLADASRSFRFNRNSDPDLNLSAGGAKLMEPALDILMLGYPRDDTTLQNRYLNFITSVEDIGSNMDYLPPDVATKSAANADDAHPSATSGDASMPGSLREPLALPGTRQGVVIEELTSLDETAGDASSMKSESTKASTATKTSLDTNNSVPLEECALEGTKNSESSPRTKSPDKDDIVGDQKKTADEVEGESGDTSAANHNSRSVGRSVCTPRT